MTTRIFIAQPDGLMILARSNGNWQVDHQLDGKPAQCVAVDPSRPERVYCGVFGGGLWRSDDCGSSWRPVGDGINLDQLMSVAVSNVERVGNYGVVYAGTEPTALFRSEDGGDTWRDLSTLRDLPSAPTWRFPPRPHTSHVRAIALDPHRPAVLYVAIEAGALVRSFDGGDTWHDRVPDGPFDSHTLATHPLAPNRIYSAAGDGFMAPGRGYIESRDGGDTWQRLGEGIAFSYLWGLAVDPADPDTVVVSGAPGPNQAHNPMGAESAVYRKAGGGPWQEVTDGLPAHQGSLSFQLAANPVEPGVFYAANNTGVYRSPDAGQSWERFDIPWPDHYRKRHAQGMVVIEA
jgi:photosystem II stability/assembly factor-like uncharacterized protein